MEIVAINDSNIEQFVPDLPQEYFMLPYASAKSDLARAALLYHHGGIYMDTDFLVGKPLSEFVSKLDDNDIVSYSDDEYGSSGTCGKQFSSNFMAARRHNGFSKTWWDNIKAKLQYECPQGGFSTEQVCCHEVGETPATKQKKCHIPWASMEHMKDPSDPQVEMHIAGSKPPTKESVAIKVDKTVSNGLTRTRRSEQASTSLINESGVDEMARLTLGREKPRTKEMDGADRGSFGQHKKPSHSSSQNLTGSRKSRGTVVVKSQKDSRERMNRPVRADKHSLLQITSMGSISTSRSTAFYGSFLGSSISLLAPDFVDHLPPGLRLYCFKGKEGMTPHLNGEIYWQHWKDERTDSTESADALYDRRFMCDVEGSDLTCSSGNWGKSFRRFDNFFDRIAYHLFFSSAGKHVTNVEELRKNRWLIGELYARSLGSHFSSPGDDTIWAVYNYPKQSGPNPFVSLNMASWRRHAPGMRIVLVNDTNVKQFVPDLPEEFFKLGHDAAKSDALRAALLYHHGGLYMDTDFLLNRPLTDVLAKLKDNDVVTYSDNDGVQSGPCGPDRSSSNFMAARKGNAFSRIWWENIKTKLAFHCDKETYRTSQSTLCCHEKGETRERFMSRNCHVPWAALEHMKDAKQASFALLEGATVASDSFISPLSLAAALSPVAGIVTELPKELNYYCFAGNETFVPHLNGEVFWQQWDTKSGRTFKEGNDAFDPKREYEHRFDCKRIGMNLECSSGTWGTSTRFMHDFFGRRAYHLFFSTTSKTAKNQAEVLNKDWLLSEMYRHALGIEKEDG
eukprot:TRINITY_DN49195_c0_g1_i1.p1 TRINITY_DN49195_c0_g1~~TRINITY_DN49195_c0_g1_i1.p1  ORF type:complete len:889 (+),score=133.17 TRINITY_DN49195_c0_g1_i1:294-2669(+)